MYKRVLARIKKNIVPFAAVVLVLVGGALYYFMGSGMPSDKSYPELVELGSRSWTFQEYSTYFQKLSDAKTAKYAFEVLARAQLSPGTDIHLLAHVVGDMLYKQEGMQGIKTCTPDFRNACSHSVVIGVLNEYGEGALPDIAQTCKEAPGGRGAYTMCFHGLGHGVLAYNGYKYDRAVEMCKKTGTPEYQDREYIECVGGATMEMVAGVHDRDVWMKEFPNYFKDSDKLYPCDASFMPKEVQAICYIHLTPRLFEAAGMNLGAPNPQFYEEAFTYCNALPADDRENRTACFGGFGKEFVVLAQERDVRDIGMMKEPALKLVRDWCALAKNTAGEYDCNAYALASLFWGGENTADASFLFCSIAPVGEMQDACYMQLTEHIRYYLGGDSRRGQLCARLPDMYQDRCTAPVGP